MAIRTFDTKMQRWRARSLKTLQDNAWVARETDATVHRSLFAPYIAQGTVLTRDVRGTAMPLAANSTSCATWMAQNLTAGNGFGSTGFNTSRYGTIPIAMTVVDSSAAGTYWQTVEKCLAGAGQTQAGVDLYCRGKIPMPKWAAPAANGDKGFALYDVATGIMREYFYMEPVAGKPDTWTALSGGYSLAKPGLVDLARTNYGMQLVSGTSAVVGMHNPLGFVGIREVLAGQINHAVAFTCANMGRGASWPARASDGLSDDPNAPRQGQWCRLPDTVNPLNNPATGRPYRPMTQLLIRAFQRYGGFASDKNLFVHAFNGEHGGQWKELYGSDPWSSGDIIEQALGGPVSVVDFPWHLTQWAPVDWGRPSPDWWLRPGQTQPWVKPGT